MKTLTFWEKMSTKKVLSFHMQVLSHFKVTHNSYCVLVDTSTSLFGEQKDQLLDQMGL